MAVEDKISEAIKPKLSHDQTMSRIFKSLAKATVDISVKTIYMEPIKTKFRVRDIRRKP